MSSPVTAARLLAAWERSRDEAPAQRALALLAGCRDVAVDEVAGWPVRARDVALFDLRIELFGPAAQATIDCPHCAERLDVELDLHELRPSTASGAGDDEMLTGEVDGHDVVARRPSTADLVAVCATSSAADAPDALLRRAITSVSAPDGRVLHGDDLDAELEQALRAWMSAQLDGDDVVLAMACSACAESIEAPFDIAAFVVADTDAWVDQLMVDVHRLAMAYGWTEAEILALSPHRRARYLDLVDGTEEPWLTR